MDSDDPLIRPVRELFVLWLYRVLQPITKELRNVPFVRGDPKTELLVPLGALHRLANFRAGLAV